MAKELGKMKCIPCEGDIDPLTGEQINEYMDQVEFWDVVEENIDGKPVKTLQKSMKFTNFRVAMKFLREVEELAESEGHHPNFCVHYSRVDFSIWTHAIGGLSENDFILAKKIDDIKG